MMVVLSKRRALHMIHELHLTWALTLSITLKDSLTLNFEQLSG
jgi:hypothetical protein